VGAAGDEEQVEVEVEAKAERAQADRLSRYPEHGPPRLFGRRRKARRRRRRCVAGLRASKMRSCRVQQDEEKRLAVLTAADFHDP
jgi:hypothetical protein